MAIFNSYVKLPEGSHPTQVLVSTWKSLILKFFHETARYWNWPPDFWDGLWYIPKMSYLPIVLFWLILSMFMMKYLLNPPIQKLVGGDWNMALIFPFSWELGICYHPNWRTPSFFRGVGQPPSSLYLMICGSETTVSTVDVSSQKQSPLNQSPMQTSMLFPQLTSIYEEFMRNFTGFPISSIDFPWFSHGFVIWSSARTRQKRGRCIQAASQKRDFSVSTIRSLGVLI